MAWRRLRPGVWIEGWAWLVTTRPLTLVACLAALVLAAAWQVPSMRFDFSPQALFETFEEDAERNRAFVETFGHGENVLVLILVAESGVLEPSTLRAIHEVSEDFAARAWVLSVESVTASSLPRSTPGGLEVDALGERAERDAEAVEALRSSALARGRLFSEDERLAAVAVELSGEMLAAEVLVPAMAELRELLDVLPAPEGAWWEVTGVPWVRAEVVRRLQLEQFIFVPITLVCYAIVLAVMFRRLSGVLLPLGVVLCSVLLTAGTMAYVGEPLNIINNIVPTLIFVIGISDAIHLLSRFEEEQRVRGTRRDAVRGTVRAMAVACFLTSFTSAVGFLSLVVSQTEILRRFGVVAAGGVLVAYVVTLTLVPSLLMRMRTRHGEREGGDSVPAEVGVMGGSAALEVGTGGRLEGWVESLARWSMRRRWGVLAGALVLVVACVLAARGVPVDSGMLEVFSPSDPVAETTRLVEEGLEGVLPLEVSLRAPPGSRVDTASVMNGLERVRLRGTEHAIVTSSSSASLLLLDTWAVWTGDPARRTGDFASDAQVLQLASLLQSGTDDPLSSWWTFDGREARLQFRLADHGGRATLAFGAEVGALMAEEFGELEDWEWHITGDAWVAAVGLRAFIRDLLSSLGAAIVIIFGFMMLTFRSVRLGLLSIPANLLPLLVTLAFMGVVGIELNTTTVILFSVSLGLAVDDTIHVLARYAEAVRSGLEGEEAIAVAVRGAGRAIVLTSVLLGMGLLVLTTSSFVPTVRFAWLTAMTIVGCLLADLILLPALLRLWPTASER